MIVLLFAIGKGKERIASYETILSNKTWRIFIFYLFNHNANLINIVFNILFYSIPFSKLGGREVDIHTNSPNFLN